MMTVRSFGMAVSRVMAVIVLLSAVRSLEVVAITWSMEASRLHPDHSMSGSALIGALLLGLGGLFLWFRPDVFAGSRGGDPESGEDLLQAKTVARILLVGVGAYFALSGVASLISHALPGGPGRTDVQILGVRLDVLSAAFDAVAGTALCYVSTRPARETK